MIAGQMSDNPLDTATVDGSQLVRQNHRFDIQAICVRCGHGK
jgi:hypothetical protein